MTKGKRNQKSNAQLDAEAGGGRVRTDKGTPETRAQVMSKFGREAIHMGHSDDNRPRAKILVQVPLDYYAMRGWVSEHQFLAGQEFHRCWHYGGVKSSAGVAKYDTLSRGEGRDAFDVNQLLHDKCQKAKKAIRGLPQALTCFNVVCIGEWASALSPRKLKFDRDSGEVSELDIRAFLGRGEQKMDWLRSALDDLADHWRMPR